MALYVLKFGGSSVATTARIRKSAEIVANVRNRGHLVAVVTSAMQGVTNQLIDVAKAFCDSFVNREYDAIISSGEQVAAGLFALCLGSIGISAKSMLGWQIPIRTSGFFSQGFISSVNKDVILNEILTNGTTPVIAGFQGISDENEIMTIGRGGSDATACAVSCAIGADECFIYTDVDGVYTADPRVVLNSKRLTQISYDEMLVLASLGAKVLQDKSVCIAKQCGVKLRVLSSFSEGGETIVTNETTYQNDRKIAGIAHNTSVCIINISGDFNGSELTERLYFNKINLEFISFFNQN
ncbi:hypothetical protein FACS1894113_3480 [Alphaproteobacteria bacterium]|nr:hypothetical protein FACS1894113_3480 [Alphaproteobacteria bacterium]